METIGLFSGVLLFIVLCLLPEVRAQNCTLRGSEEVHDHKKAKRNLCIGLISITHSSPWTAI